MTVQEGEVPSATGPAKLIISESPTRVDYYNDPYVDAILHDLVSESLGMTSAAQKPIEKTTQEQLWVESAEGLEVPGVHSAIVHAPSANEHGVSRLDAKNVIGLGGANGHLSMSGQQFESYDLNVTVWKPILTSAPQPSTQDSASASGPAWDQVGADTPVHASVNGPTRKPATNSPQDAHVNGPVWKPTMHSVTAPAWKPVLSPIESPRPGTAKSAKAGSQTDFFLGIPHPGPARESHSGQMWEEAATREAEAMAPKLPERAPDFAESAKPPDSVKDKVRRSLEMVKKAGVDSMLGSTVIIPSYLLADGSLGKDQGSGNMPSSPLLVFVDSTEGAQVAGQLKQQLELVLGPKQVSDLAQTAPEAVLEKIVGRIDGFVRLGDRLANHVREKLRILVCGGDSTVVWVLSALQSLGLQTSIPIALIPLGKVNDVAFCLGWGKSYQATDRMGLTGLLLHVAAADSKFIDSWRCRMTTAQAADSALALPKSLRQFQKIITDEAGRTTHEGPFWNHITIGLDAESTFYQQTGNSRPKKTTQKSPGLLSCFSCATPRPLTLRSMVVVYWQDNEGEWKQLDLPASLQSLVLLNLPCYGGKADHWGQPSTGALSYADDSLLEIIGFAEKASQVYRLAQARAVRVELHGLSSAETFVRMDGEAWKQPLSTGDTALPAVLEVECSSPCNVLVTEESAVRSLPENPVQVAAGKAGRALKPGTALSSVAAPVPTSFLNRRFTTGGRIEGNLAPKNFEPPNPNRQLLNSAKNAFRSSRSRIRSLSGAFNIELEEVEDVPSPKRTAADFFKTIPKQESAEEYAAQLREEEANKKSVKRLSRHSYSGPITFTSEKPESSRPKFHSGEVKKGGSATPANEGGGSERGAATSALPEGAATSAEEGRVATLAREEEGATLAKNARPPSSKRSSRGERSFSGPLPVYSKENSLSMKFFSGPMFKKVVKGGSSAKRPEETPSKKKEGSENAGVSRGAEPTETVSEEVLTSAEPQPPSTPEVKPRRKSRDADVIKPHSGPLPAAAIEEAVRPLRGFTQDPLARESEL